jgi:hypothetical protein
MEEWSTCVPPVEGLSDSPEIWGLHWQYRDINREANLGRLPIRAVDCCSAGKALCE